MVTGGVGLATGADMAATGEKIGGGGDVRPYLAAISSRRRLHPSPPTPPYPPASPRSLPTALSLPPDPDGDR